MQRQQQDGAEDFPEVIAGDPYSAASRPRTAGEARTLGQHARGAGDRVGEVEVRRPPSAKAARLGSPPEARQRLARAATASLGAIASRAREMRMLGVERPAQGRQRIERQAVAEHVGQRAQDRPVLAGVARREAGAVAWSAPGPRVLT